MTTTSQETKGNWAKAPAINKYKAEKVESRLGDWMTWQVAKSQPVTVIMVPTANKKVIWEVKGQTRTLGQTLHQKWRPTRGKRLGMKSSRINSKPCLNKEIGRYQCSGWEALLDNLIEKSIKRSCYEIESFRARKNSVGELTTYESWVPNVRCGRERGELLPIF
jgi:hypothetical protein